MKLTNFRLCSAHIDNVQVFQVKKTYSYTYLFFIGFLCLDWVLFGSMHFIFRHATIAQIPEYIPLKNLIVTVTGIIEIAIGILILLPQTRHLAALTSLALLALFIPAVYHILTSESALLGSPTIQAVFRNFIIPHNLLLAVGSIYLMRSGLTD